MSRLSDLIESEFPRRKVVVIGDAVADQFLQGTIARVSREAPVFILDHENTDTRPGGAANAASNVASLGGRAFMVGLIGNDENGELLRSALVAHDVDCGGMIVVDGLRTTTKVRVLAGQHYAPRQQVIRIDYAQRAPIGKEAREALLGSIESSCTDADAIIVSDYGYGSVDEEIAMSALRLAESVGIPLIIDSRYRLDKFRGAVAATPNQEEVEQILGSELDDDSCDELRRRLEYKALLVTQGNKGMRLYEDGMSPKRFEAVGSKEPLDVTGAGDTVIGAFALGLASGLSFSDSAMIANHAGGIVVMKRGTAVATMDELRASLDLEPDDLSQASRM